MEEEKGDEVGQSYQPAVSQFKQPIREPDSVSAEFAMSELNLAFSLLKVAETASGLKRRSQVWQEASAICDGML
jgi:hypothetical protein